MLVLTCQNGDGFGSVFFTAQNWDRSGTTPTQGVAVRAAWRLVCGRGAGRAPLFFRLAEIFLFFHDFYKKCSPYLHYTLPQKR